MERDLEPGDFLIFQLESGFALLRLLDVDEDDTWHLAAYSDLFPSVESAEEAIDRDALKLSEHHIALTRRAFESTQVARVKNRALVASDIESLNAWRSAPARHVSDRSVRLLLGLR
jgi:hypothetical protein